MSRSGPNNTLEPTVHRRACARRLRHQRDAHYVRARSSGLVAPTGDRGDSGRRAGRSAARGSHTSLRGTHVLLPSQMLNQDA